MILRGGASEHCQLRHQTVRPDRMTIIIGRSTSASTCQQAPIHTQDETPPNPGGDEVNYANLTVSFCFHFFPE